MIVGDNPFPDHPLFNWDMQWEPIASPMVVFNERDLTVDEERSRIRQELERQSRPFGFAQALED